MKIRCAAAALLSCTAILAFAKDNASGQFEIRTLSNRADLISGGDALVEVRVPQTAPLQHVRLFLNGHDVTSVFTTDAASRVMRGVLTGLVVGPNEFLADSNGQGKGRPRAALTITNHPIGGPVLLASQTQPWICATPTAQPAAGNTPASNASGLTTSASDAQCNIATEVHLFYRTKTSNCAFVLPDPSPTTTAPTPANSCFQPYNPATTNPDDVADTTTANGVTMKYIVRVERGTLNRGIYDIAVLFDPTQPWTALAPQPQWNGKVLYTFGASTGQPRLQFRSEQNWVIGGITGLNDDSALRLGFMVADNSLTDSLYNSNRVLVAETVMMMKEHIVDTYGPIAYTMGNGCSGGSIQQNTVSSIFPGLLDGIQPACDFPDSITTGMEVSDCVLLVNLYAETDWQALMTLGGYTTAQINAKKAAINGHLDHLGCQSWNNSFGFNNKPGNYVPFLVLNATTGAMGFVGAPRNNCLLPAALVYDPVTNPNGTRCGDPDLATAVWGTTANENAPASVRARQTGDNVGIQYGLGALMSGTITPEEFVTLNEKIGGFDADSNRRAQRTVADRAALDIAYQAGIVSSGRNLGKLPIIDSRGWDETGIHYIWRSFSERARIDGENGDHGNQVMWRYGTGLLPGTPAQIAAVTVKSFLTMDAWLSTLNVDAPKETLNSVRTHAQVVAAKPAAAVDFCFLTGDVNFTTPITDMALCDADPRLAKHASPRQVAGGPLAENILKCQLKPLNAADYAPIVFTSDQLARLNATFPDGVCDWTKPGVGQQAPQSPLTFVDGPGGEPLPPAPQAESAPER
ncbi:MAG TPA: DUF6351 family protein [Burkholderiales bacterium]|nr:DUF6351 family protein [Burkholderiales bacterium]